MIGYDNLPALLDHTPNQWESMDSFLYARTQGINSKTRRVKKEKEGYIRGKTLYAECVHLTASEFKKLAARYGEKNTKRAIDKLSAWKLAKGKRYRSDYGAILSWAMGSVMGQKGAAVPEPLKRDYCPECGVAGGNHGAFCSLNKE